MRKEKRKGEKERGGKKKNRNQSASPLPEVRKQDM